MKKRILRLFGSKHLTIADRALERFNQGKPVSETAKKMFSKETSQSLNLRFAEAREKIAKAH